ncbi:MAG: Adenosylhomocysteinase, partial [uncultured Friedmanniella sp.]
GLPRRRPDPGRLRPPRDHARRARDAGTDGHARAVRGVEAAGRRPDRRLAAHDHPDRGADRDPGRPGGRGALGQLQHLLHPGPGRCGRGGGRRHPGRPGRRAGLRLEGRVPRGVLGPDAGDPALARRPAGQHDPRRRRRRHPAGAPGGRGGEDRAGARGAGRRPRGAARHHRADQAEPRGGRRLAGDRQRHPGRHRGDHHRRAPALRHVSRRPAALPGHQRQRLGDQVEVRQQVRHPALAGRRAEPGHRRADRRQDGRGLRLRRRRQGLRRGAARPGGPGAGDRGRPDLRAAG